MNITIAIPTFNRCANLAILIDSIEKINVPKGVKLFVAISNSASLDNTSIYLDILKLSNPEKYLIHNKISRQTNWYTLMQMVPKETDYVWLIGDDDVILNPNCLKEIFSIIQDSKGELKALFMPMKKKIGAKGFESGLLYDLCNKYGFIEVMGWMSSNFIDYKFYLQIYELFGEKLNYRAARSEIVYKNRIGLYLHATQTYKVLFSHKVGLLFTDFIDEQPYERNLNTILQSNGYAKKKYYSGRFFYDLDDINQINKLNNFMPGRFFYRYHNRDLILMLYQIAYEGSKSREFRKEETNTQINILRDAVAYSKLSDYKVFYQIIDALVADILLGCELSNGEAKSIGDFFKVREYSDKVDEIKV